MHKIIWRNANINIINPRSYTFITARKRSLGRLCFYRCLSVHRGACMVAWWGACVVVGGAWLWGDMHSCRGCVVAGGHAWLWGTCMVAGGIHGCGGVCMVAGGHAWWQGNMHGGRGSGMRGIQWDTVNEQVVCILLECILIKTKPWNLSYVKTFCA